MAKEKPFEAKIDAFYKKNTIDMMMFGWVMAITKILPAVRQKQAICMFLEYMGLSEDDYPLRSAEQTIRRIKQNYLWRTKK